MSRRPAWRLTARIGAALGLVVAAGCAASAATSRWRWQPDAAVVHVDTAYTSGGVRIAVERFAPADGRCTPRARTAAGHACPAVLVLHPSSGLSSPGGASVRRWADALARGGRVAYVVHYFDRTGDRATDDAREAAVFPVWTTALVDAVTFVRSDPAVDSTRVSAFGYSLGGYLALALGAADPRVSRLVVLSGGLFDTFTPRRLPPTLLLHGAEDRVVPLVEAERVVDVLESLRVAHRLVVYPGRAHGLSADVLPDAIARVTAFLDPALVVPGPGVVPSVVSARWTPAAPARVPVRAAVARADRVTPVVPRHVTYRPTAGRMRGTGSRDERTDAWTSTSISSTAQAGADTAQHDASFPRLLPADAQRFPRMV